MLDFDHYTKLKKASIVPEHIRKMFEDDGELGKVLIEMCVPAVRVAIYAATHEPLLFSELAEKMQNAKKLAPYFHRTMPPGKMYRSLSLLGDECLECILSELGSSYSVFMGLHDSVNHDFDAFKKVLQGWDGNFSQITPICRLLYLELYLNDYFEWIIKEANRIDEITDIAQQYQEGAAFVKNSSGVITTMLKDVFNDKSDDELNNRLEKTFDDYLDDTLKLAAEALKHDEVLSINYKEEFLKGVLAVDPNVEIADIEQIPESIFYKVLLIAYHFLATETSISQPAKGVIREILFAPEYETIWKQYEDSNSIDYLIEEFEPIVGTPQIEDSDAVEVKDKLNRSDENDSVYTPKIKGRWRLQAYLSRPVEPKEDHCEGIKDDIIQCGDAALTKFIQKIADLGYIDDDPTTKNSFAYVLTGRGGFKTGIIDVKWHHTKANEGKVSESVLVLLYISKYMFENRTGETYTQLFKHLNAGTNPYIKDGKDQSPSYADNVDDSFKAYFKKCFEKKRNKPIAKL